MKKLNLNLPILDEVGVHILKEQTLGTAMAKALSKSAPTTVAEIEKFYNWAAILGKNKELEIDQPDLETLKQFTILHPSMPAQIKQPVKLAIDKLIT